jgi:hypothetical protein
MEPTSERPRGDDERRAWLPLVAVVALIGVLSLALFVAFRNEGDADGVTGTLPASFPALTTAAPTTSTTPPTTAAPAPVTTLPVPRRTTPTGGVAGGRQTTTTVNGNPQTALDQLADQTGATASDIVPVGVDLFAMLVRAGSGRLMRWDGSEWAESALVDAPALVRTVDATDVTGDGVPDFIVTLEGLNNPAGVYSAQMLHFQFLPFNTTNGLQDFVANLRVELGQLVSPFTDASGTRTLVWTWTGRMFETR